MKLLRTIRLDASDTFVFERPAEPGEWAVSGAFVFWDRGPDVLEGRTRSAFRSGFLGVNSLGWSTLVQIVETSEVERARLVEALAKQLVAHFGAPDLAAAKSAAEEEVAFTESLCSEPKDTLIAVHRSLENGVVREQFRTLRRREGAEPSRPFSFFEVVGEDETAQETIDLVSLTERERK
jgi:uncharacterized protein DUF6505